MSTIRNETMPMPKQQKQTQFFSYYKSSEEDSLRCAVSGCSGRGHHKVLLDLKNPKDTVYMCLDHVTAHNKTINYFQNMGTHEIEAEIKADTVWRLPTWPICGDYRRFLIERDIFSFFGTGKKETVADSGPSFPKEVQSAAQTLNISLPIELNHLKKIYKSKVKQHHPDLNQNKKEAEEELKKINIAYKTLFNYLTHA